MKRSAFLKYLSKNGCIISREGKKHTIFWNSNTHKASGVPRHKEIKDLIAEIICKELEITPPKK